MYVTVRQPDDTSWRKQATKLSHHCMSKRVVTRFPTSISGRRSNCRRDPIARSKVQRMDRHALHDPQVVFCHSGNSAFVVGFLLGFPAALSTESGGPAAGSQFETVLPRGRCSRNSTRSSHSRCPLCSPGQLQMLLLNANDPLFVAPAVFAPHWCSSRASETPPPPGAYRI